MDLKNATHFGQDWGGLVGLRVVAEMPDRFARVVVSNTGMVAGEGTLAKKANNHFGIKCHKGWKGKSIRHDDDEENECFRSYKNPLKSYRDHSLFLVDRDRYSGLFELKRKDYKGWAKGLKAAGYATDPKYAEKLISLIERFNLTRFDE